MKKIIYIFFIIFLFIGCSNDIPINDKLNELWNEIKSKYIAYQQICADISNVVQYPSPWTKEAEETFIIPDETICSMNSCELIETWLTHPDRVLGPWCVLCSNLSYPGVTYFNNRVFNDRVLKELFERNDYVSILTARYLSVIEQNNENLKIVECLEMLLASDICMSALTDDEQLQLLIMALKKIENDKAHGKTTRHIMVAVMIAYNYTPFINEKNNYYMPYSVKSEKNGFNEDTFGYVICDFDVVEQYAKQFLNEKQ
jgi:hypothetical protein